MTAFTDAQFWSLIALAPPQDTPDDLGAFAQDTDLQAVEAALAALSVDEKIAFFRLFSEKLHALDTPAHYAQCRVGGDETSADVFLYARCHVLSLGRETYEQVLNDPCRFPADLWFEDVLSIATGTYYESAHEQNANPDAIPSYESFENPAWHNT